MEKICSWRWRPIPGQPREDAFYYKAEDNWLYIKRGDAEAVKATPALWMRDTLARKQDAPMPHMQNVLDFLNARLTGEETHPPDWAFQSRITE